MDKLKVLRRAAVVVGAVGVSLVASLAAMAQSAPPLGSSAHFRAIKVDVAPLARGVGEPTASWMAQALPGPLQEAFAGRVTPGDRRAPTLIVRIDTVFLGQSGPGGLELGNDAEARDEIQGAGVVVGADGRTLGVYPLFTVQNNFTGGVNYEMGTEHRRVAELAQSFARWLPGQMGL
jgi:hypothetical protein